MTGGRLLRAKDFLGNQRFMLTYGDGLADIDIPSLIKCHEDSGCAATLTTIQPVGKFGAITFGGEGRVRSFSEKPDESGTWINAGFFVMEPEVFDYLEKYGDGDRTILERSPLEHIARDGKLNSYRHNGYWKAMDTLNDKNILTSLWLHGKAPWALWLKK
jgi:glucose-1-phosphate cytidylyltransferase